MNKHIEKIKKQAAQEAMKAGLVILGTVGGMVVIKSIRKFTQDNPSMDTAMQYALPIIVAGGGIIIAAATDEKSKAKYFGYGLSVAGAIEGIKLIPVAKDYLSGILGETEIPAASAFYTENEAQQKLMSGFGLSDLPVGNTMMQPAAMMQNNLPDLEGAEDTRNEDLGYNPASTDDEVKGIL
jgi:hypothetical protein